MTELAHARLAPSSAERWVHCTGSVVMQERYPQTEESEDAREGTASHWVGSEVLEACRDGGDGVNYVASAEEYEGQTAPNGVIISEEMIEGALEYVENVLKVVADTGGALTDLHIEERVDIPRIHAETWGTPDAWYFDKVKGVLYVWDYKYGRRIVDPYENWQMIEYTLGIITQLFPDKNEPEIVIDNRIVQPRSFHHEGPVRSWRTYPEYLRASVNILQAAAIEALGDDPHTCSGDWCRDCTGRHVCRTYQQASMCGVDIIGDLSADVLSPEALGIELRTLKRAANAVKYRLEALEVQAIETIRGGELVPGWGTAEGKGHQKWNKPNAEIFALGDLMEVETRKEAVPITPKQAIKAGLHEATVQAYSIVPSTGLKLVPDDGSKAKRVFSQS